MWFLESKILQALNQAHQAKIQFTADQQAQYTARIMAADTSRILTIAGDKAEIHVKGVLTNSPDIFAMFFGGGNTTYPEIISALAEADADTNIDEIIMRFDSGGGGILGMFDTIAAIQTTKTPITAVVGTMAASAAFALASQADSLIASNRASMVGSIGIAIDTFVFDEQVSITSTHAPKKRPDLRTEKGKAIVVEELDAIHELFAEAIAVGRNTTEEKVNAEFGQGATLLADEALKRGMIDSIAGSTPLKVVKSAKQTTVHRGGQQPEAGPMDLIELKAKHPDVYQAAVNVGQIEGQTKERDRVGAHLTLGKASGAMETAITAIKEGSEMTATLTAEYMAAGMNRQDVSNRQDDDVDASAADNVNTDDEVDQGVTVLNLVEAKVGVKKGVSDHA